MSYCEWNLVFETIAADKYWEKVPAEERCLHISPVQEQKPAIPGATASSDGIDHDAHQESYAAAVKRESKKSVKVEELKIFDTDGSSFSSFEDDGGIKIDSDFSRCKQPSRRDVVKPLIFVLDGKETLASFLEVIES